MRVYPIAIEIVRTPNKDDVLPLSKSLVGVSGKIYKELPVPAGTIISISTVGYNLCVRPLNLRFAQVMTGLPVVQEQGLVGTGRLRISPGAMAGHEPET